MKTTNYLSINDVIGEHYIILDILAKDAFEILYLVRDTNRSESLFVIKELFFETFCSREEHIVIIDAQAQGVFYKQKQAIISKVNKVKNHHDPSELKTFGFFEENNTIYTIMEYSTDVDMSDYLEFEAETLSSNSSSKNATHRNSLKYLLALGVLLLLAYVGYKSYKNHTQPEVFNDNDLKPKIKLRDHTQALTTVLKSVKVEEKNNTKKDNNEKDNNEKNNSKKIPILPTPLVKETDLTIEINKTSMDNNMTRVDTLVKDSNLSEEKSKDRNTSSPNLDDNQTSLTEKEIQRFLEAFINASSNGSIEEVLNFYDTKIEKYFKFNHTNRDVVKRDTLKYNKKWTHREFKIEDFKILKQYKQNKQEYLHLETTTKWTIANKNGLKRQGKSKGFMKLKLTDQGLKVLSIYGLN